MRRARATRFAIVFGALLAGTCETPAVFEALTGTPSPHGCR